MGTSDFTVSDYLLQRLTELGLGHMFAVPGDYAGDFLKRLEAYDPIERVGTQCELGAGYAADAYARYAGIGAACVQYGVGSMSLLNCVAGSFVERVPVLVLSASPSKKDRKIEKQQGVLFHHSTGDLRVDRDIFSTVTVASEIIRNGRKAPRRIDRALAAMMTHRRPVYIEVLADVWTAACARPTEPLRPARRPRRRKSTRKLLEAIVAKIERSERPVLWLGVELQRFGLQDLAQELVEASGLRFTTTSLGKTVLDESQPAFAGTYAGPASLDSTRELMERSDCVITLGALITDDYLDIIANQYADMIVVTDTQARVGDLWYSEVPLRGVVQGLLDWFRERGAARNELEPADAVRAAAPADGDLSLSYERFYERLSRRIAANGFGGETSLVLGESTSLYVFGNQMGLPRDSFVANAAWGSLGHETGAALGVALGSGRRPIVVAGDGGFRMVCQEVLSLSYCEVDGVLFVLSNGTYTIEQAFVNLAAFEPDGSFAPFDVLPTPDYLALATAFGARGIRVETLDELDAALDAVAKRGKRPTIVEVVIPEKKLPPQLRRLATP